MTTVEELTKQLTKEKLASKFFQQSERAALQALENVTQELKAVKNDLNARDALQTQLQKDSSIMALNIGDLQQHCHLLQSELSDRVRELTVVKFDSAEAVKALEKQLSAAKNAKVQAESDVASLKGQVELLSNIIKGSDDLTVASIPTALAEQFDAKQWKKKHDAVVDEIKDLKKELENVKYLWKEERLEAQRANILLVCTQRMVEHLTNSATRPQRMHSTKEEQEQLAKLQEVISTLTASQISEIVKDNAAIRRESDRLQNELSAANKLSSELKAECAELKTKLATATAKEKVTAEALTKQKAEEIVRLAESKQRMLEQGSVAAILMSFYTAPSRCPHCRGGLSDTLGLDLLAEAAGCSSVDELVSLMVSSVSDKISSAYRETFLDQVAAVAPPTTISMAAQLVGPVPPGLMFFPPRHFSRLLEMTQFISEAQAYSLAVQFMTVGARFMCTPEIVDEILSSVRFLWMSVALIESEIARVERTMLDGTISSSGRLPHAHHSVGIALTVPRALLARLTQALRVKATVFQWTSGKTSNPSHALPPVFEDPSHPVVVEMLRIRPSYVFLPRSIRETMSVKGMTSVSVPTLFELQPLCV